jgi:Flp pilus assembly protein TadD
LKEKGLLFVLSAALMGIMFCIPQNDFFKTVYAPYDLSSEGYSLLSRVFNACIAFISYLYKTIWPFDLAIFYPYPTEIPVWNIIGAVVLIVSISSFAIILASRIPYFFTGWFWFLLTIAPVLGIIQIGGHAMADRYTYIPLIGIFIIPAWGVSSFFHHKQIQRKIVMPAALVTLVIMACLAWLQCGYWKNGITLFERALKITDGSYVTHNNLALALAEKGRINEAIYHYNQSIKIVPDGVPYNNLGNIYADQGDDEKAMLCYDEAIRIRPDYADAYYNRALIYAKQNRYQQALDDYHKAISLKPSWKALNNRGNIYKRLGQYKQAIEDYNRAIKIEMRYPGLFVNRASAYFNNGDIKSGCSDLQRACDLGYCNKMEEAKSKDLCQ